MRPTITLAALFLLASCSADPTTETTGTRAHRTAPTDTTTAPSLRFDMESDSMIEDEETLYFNADEWDEVNVDADL